MRTIFVFVHFGLALCYPLLPALRASSDPTFRFRQTEIRQAFLHAYNSYKRAAWGHDELQIHLGNEGPLDWLGGLALTVVDNLDTLLIMEAEAEYEEALKLLASLDYNRDISVSAFEMTIRHLGGLLGAHTLRPSPMLLSKAKDLGNRLIKAWSGKRLYRNINLKTGEGSDTPNLAELGTSQLELRSLSWFTADPLYAQIADKLHNFTTAMRFSSGLAPTFSGGRDVSMGGESDSYYEYLLKSWVQNKSATHFASEYLESMRGMQHLLVRHSSSSNLTYVTRATLQNGNYIPNYSFEYMACFVPGMLALGSTVLGASPLYSADIASQHQTLALQVAHTCFTIGNTSASRLPPDGIVFVANSSVPYVAANPRYLLRPEASESWFYLSRLGLQPSKAQEYAWSFFLALNSSCRSTGGFQGVVDVNSARLLPDSVQQSFFLSETLKYLYLTFSPTALLDLQQFVFNTEAHPLPLIDKPLPPYFTFRDNDESAHAVIIIVTFIALALLAGIALSFAYVTLLQVQKSAVEPVDCEMDSFDFESQN